MQADTAVHETGARAASDAAGKYLTFGVGSDRYGIPIRFVREIVVVPPITPVPQSPAYVLGVINLRGRILPVLDLRQRLGLPPAEVGERTCMVVVERGGLTGLRVDSVGDVLDLAAEQIEPPPPRSAAPGDALVIGVGQARDAVIVLLDVETVLRDAPGATTRD